MDSENLFHLFSDGEDELRRMLLSPDLLVSLKKENIMRVIRGARPTISVPFDLAAAVEGQMGFAEKMHQISWIRNPLVYRILTNAIGRYETFIKLFSLSSVHPGCPALDIDLVWRTHHLSPRSYCIWSRHKANKKFINRNETIEN